MPREVNFCPYCGTGQHARVDNPAHARPPVPARPAFSMPALADAAVVHTRAQQPPREPDPEPVQASPAANAPTPAPAAQGWGRKAAPAVKPAPGQRGPADRGPADRRPVRLRWWLLLLAAVLGLWVWDKPRKTEARIERALALGAECKLNEAQAELISLRSARASPEQLQRLQQGLNDASRDCERKQQRAKAWRDTEAAVEVAIEGASFIRANQRLQAFVRKWGDDGQTRKLAERITAARVAWQDSDAGKLEMAKADCRTRGGRWLAGSCW